MIRVCFDYEPEPEEIDTDDKTGLTESAFNDIHDHLGEYFGAENISIEKGAA